ncbi:hypothetical protein [Sphingomonas baiyangensis]|uniref:Uncharacterized protein n=1 Tax=Sphingomonas baiyangensis TaxID=2572576 RepID=A0A4V5PUU4_9SPHN|nr:hypothetical protein [Sphingomonas baiyangensis]TKD51518.1 hypothetical protein FBR43_12710 [Sphingomonas baiyangensis]
MAELVERVGGMMTKGANPVEYREYVHLKLYDIAIGKEDANPIGKRAKVSTADRLAAIKLLGEYERESARILSEGRQQQFNAAMDYKERWTAKFHAAEKAGRPVPTCLPHPDDMIVHMPSGRVSIVGPCTPAEQIELEERVANRDEIVASLKALSEGEPTSANKRLVNKLRKVLRGYNEILPPRLAVEVPPPLR